MDTVERNQSLFGTKSGGTDYNPNYTSILKRDGIMVPDMSKISRRKSMHAAAYSMNESILDRT